MMDVSSLKTLFGGKVCCLGCAMKALEMGGDLLNFMLVTDTTVENLRENEPPGHVRARLSLLDIEDFLKLGTASRAVTECFTPNPAPVIHPNYYQKDIINVKFKLNGSKVKMGEIKRGQLLMVYKWDDGCEIARQVIDNLKADFKKKISRNGLFPNLNGVKFDSVVSIDAGSGTIQIERFLEKWIREDKKMEDWSSRPLEDQAVHLYKGLRTPEKIGLIHLKNLSGVDEERLKAKFWVDYMKACVGSLEDVLVVLEIGFREFNARELQTKNEALRFIRRDSSKHFYTNGLWLDTSNSSWPYLLVPKEKADHPEKMEKDPKKMKVRPILKKKSSTNT